MGNFWQDPPAGFGAVVSYAGQKKFMNDKSQDRKEWPNPTQSLTPKNVRFTYFIAGPQRASKRV